MREIISGRDKNSIIKIAQIGIDSQLYMPFEYCHIRKFLRQVIDSGDLKIIHSWVTGEITKAIIVYEDKTPAGICLLIKRKNDYIIEVFVAERFRKKGIGYALIQEAKKRILKTIYVFKTSSWRDMDFITEQGIKIFRG